MANIALQSSTELTEETVQTLIQAGIIPAGTPHAQIKVFAQICADKGLSPFSKEIYLVAYNGQYTPIVGINGFRKLASKTGQLAGCDDAKFDIQSSGAFFTAAELISKKQYPQTATVTVHRIVCGMRVSFTHTAAFSEFTTGKQKWNTMPFQMIAKVAESFAYRKGFSDETSGLSVEEEIGAISDLTIKPEFEENPRPIMSPQHPKWKGCIAALEIGSTTIEAVKKVYDISDEDLGTLFLLAKKMPDLTPEHEKWIPAIKALIEGKTTIEAIKKKFTISTEYEKLMKEEWEANA